MDNISRAASAEGNLAGYFPKARIAVSLLFLINGFVIGSWATKIPEFAERLKVDESGLGLLLLVFGIGSLVLMPLAGSQIARFGSARVVVAATILFLPTLLLVTVIEGVWMGALALFLFGGLTGAMDVAMNANAVEVERRMRRSIMSSCHAFWSLGGLFGAGLGGFAIVRFGIMGHALIITVLAALVFLAARPMILKDAPHAAEEKAASRLPLTWLPWLIGLMALFAMIPEGAVLDWGAIYLRNELGATVAMSGFGFAAFSLTMAVMRFLGDLVRDRLGAVLTLRISTVLSFIGLAVAGIAPSAPVAMIGFAVAGIGISNMVPIAFSAAGNVPGLAAGIGLSVVTTLGYSGILFAPSIIGFVAARTGLAPIYLALALFNILVFVLSSLARHADRPA